MLNIIRIGFRIENLKKKSEKCSLIFTYPNDKIENTFHLQYWMLKIENLLLLNRTTTPFVSSNFAVIDWRFDDIKSFDTFRSSPPRHRRTDWRLIVRMLNTIKI